MVRRLPPGAGGAEFAATLAIRCAAGKTDSCVEVNGHRIEPSNLCILGIVPAP